MYHNCFNTFSSPTAFPSPSALSVWLLPSGFHVTCIAPHPDYNLFLLLMILISSFLPCPPS